MGKVIRYIGRSLTAVVVGLMSLIVLLLVLIYLPPVQSFIIDKVLDSVSEDMEFNLSVGDARIGFPLDIQLSEISVVRKTDGAQIAGVGNVTADIELLPLFNGLVCADSITLSDVNLDTRDVIATMGLDGYLHSAKVFDADFNLDRAHLSIMTVALDKSDLNIVLNDTIVEDSTEEETEPVLNTVNVGVLSLNNIGCNLVAVSDGDSTFVGGKMHNGVLSAMIDLGNGKYIVRGMDIDGLSGNFVSQVFSANIETADLEIPEMVIDSSFIRAKQFGLTLNNSCRLDAKKLYYNFENGDISADASIECTDVKKVAGILPSDMLAGIKIPEGSRLTIDAQLRNKDITAQYVSLDASGVASVRLHDATYNMDSGALSAGINAKVINSEKLMAVLPRGMVPGLAIPDGMTFHADVSMKDKNLSAKNLSLEMKGGSRIRMAKADYNMADESYDVDMVIDKVFISNFVKMPETVYFDGHIKAKGRGFDFLAPGTYSVASIRVDSMAYDKYDLASIDSDINLGGSALTAHANIADDNLIGTIDYDGMLTKQRITGRLDLNIGNLNLQGLGLSETSHNVSTYSTVSLDTDLKTMLKVDAGVMGMNVQLGGKNILIDEFVAYANASDEGTSVVMYSGDMDFELRSPLGYQELLAGYADVADLALAQLKSMDIDVSKWKEKMPEASLSAHLGTDNPISNLLELYDVWFDGVDIDAWTSSDIGVECEGFLDRLQIGDFRTEQIELGIQEDSTSLNYDIMTSVPEQTGLKPFTLKVGGCLSGKAMQTRLHYLDDKGIEGVDLGLRAQAVDTVLCMDVYPFNPILGYRQFEVCDTNYINLHKKNRIFANVNLKSLVDSCQISLIANPEDSYLQNVHLKVDNLDLSPMMSVLPFMPAVAGMVKGDLSFIQGIDTTFAIGGNLLVDDLTYEGTKVGDIGTVLTYNPTKDGGHQVFGQISRNEEEIMELKGNYHDELDATLLLDSLPLDVISAFAPELPVAMEGKICGLLKAKGKTDNMHLDGFVTPMAARFFSKVYSLNIGIDNDTIVVHDSKINFNQLHISSAGDNQITMAGEIDLSNIDRPWMNISLSGRGIELIDAPKTRQSELYGKVNGDLMIRARGNTDALSIMGRVKLLNTSDVTYVMKNTALSMGYRLDDIVTFVDFSLPPDTTAKERKSFIGLNMNLSLEVEQGAKIKCIFSADGKSYVDIRGGGTLTMLHLPEGVSQLTGRYTIDKGEMRYANSVIPLKTFTIQDGSYIEFTGEPTNPKLSLAATERVRASVSNSDRSTRMVTFNTGLRLSKTLQDLGLEFTIEAPEDVNVQQELASMTAEDKNKLALSMLATGMYLSNSNADGFNTTNALNNFLQGEINNIAGKAFSSVLKMDMNLGVEQTAGNDGNTHTDYSFKFSKRMFSDRLNVVVGGMINTGGASNNNNRAGTYIDDVSLEWRLDKSSTQYVRLFHGTDFNNLLEGQITENGAGLVLRKKVNDWKDLWKLFQIKK